MNESQTISRREFLWRSALFGAGLTLGADISSVKASSVLGANDRVRVGIIGLGVRGCQHINHYLSLPNVEIAAICDLQENFLSKTVGNLRTAGTKSVIGAKDYRRLLDMTDLDAVSIAVPRKLRAAMATDTIQAGKNVLLEKPFSSTASEGKRLAAVADKHRRIVQQRDENFFVPESGLFDGGGFHLIDGIKQIRSSKTIFSHSQLSLKSEANTTYALPELALDELDVARCMLGVSAPTNVSTIGFSQNNIAPLPSILTQLEFNDEKGDLRHIQLEIKTSPARTIYESEKISSVGTLPHVAAHFESRSDLIGKRGKLSIYCDFLQGQSTSQQNFANFIDCIRENNRDGLINPLSEARKSNLLLHLTELSLKFERSFDFDPVLEKVVGDVEIDRHL